MIEIGERTRITGEFRNEAGALANPTTVTVRLRTPAGVVSSITPTSASTGIWSFEVVPDMGGRYKARMTGSGGIDQSRMIEFVVNQDEVG